MKKLDLLLLALFMLIFAALSLGAITKNGVNTTMQQSDIKKSVASAKRYEWLMTGSQRLASGYPFGYADYGVSMAGGDSVSFNFGFHVAGVVVELPFMRANADGPCTLFAFTQFGGTDSTTAGESDAVYVDTTSGGDSVVVRSTVATDTLVIPGPGMNYGNAIVPYSVRLPWTLDSLRAVAAESLNVIGVYAWGDTL